MEELAKKVSSYQLFNFLLTGVVLAVITSHTTSINLMFDDILTGLFVYYFLGFVVSRVGSLIIEPLYKKLRIVKYAEYQDYLKAVKKDTKIDILSQENNMYRTFISMLLVFLALYGVDKYNSQILQSSTSVLVLIIGLLVLFSLAYRKQNSYINKRIANR